MKAHLVPNQDQEKIQERFTMTSFVIGIFAVASIVYSLMEAQTAGEKYFFQSTGILLFAFTAFVYAVGGMKTSQGVELFLNRILGVISFAGVLFGLALFTM
jgi:hypothetical protein